MGLIYSVENQIRISVLFSKMKQSYIEIEPTLNYLSFS